MKRGITFWEALFIVALIFKIRELDPVPSWFIVFLPLIIQAVLSIAGPIANYFGVDGRLSFWLYKIVLKWTIRGKAKEARKVMRNAYQSGRRAAANPGGYVDPENFGK